MSDPEAIYSDLGFDGDGIPSLESQSECSEALESILAGNAELIHRNEFRDVYKHRNRSGSFVAVKLFKKLNRMVSNDGDQMITDETAPQRGQADDEFDMLKMLPKGDPRLVRFRGALFATPHASSQLRQSNNLAVLLFDFYNGGSLEELIARHHSMGRYIPEAFIWHLALSLSGAIKALHHQEMAHGDIKACNVMLHWAEGVPRVASYPEIRLVDFGASDVRREYSNLTHPDLLEELSDFFFLMEKLVKIAKGPERDADDVARRSPEPRPDELTELRMFSTWIEESAINPRLVEFSPDAKLEKITAYSMNESLSRLAPSLIYRRFEHLPDWDMFM